jgi:hypothetical protein
MLWNSLVYLDCFNFKSLSLQVYSLNLIVEILILLKFQYK